jgi:hypothetical protein
VDDLLGRERKKTMGTIRVKRVDGPAKKKKKRKKEGPPGSPRSGGDGGKKG